MAKLEKQSKRKISLDFRPETWYNEGETLGSKKQSKEKKVSGLKKQGCKICKGQSVARCIICGHKKKKVTAFRDMDRDEQLRIIGKRNVINFLHALDRTNSKANNASTHSLHVDDELKKHREWAFEIYKKVKVFGQDPRSIAKQEELTPSQIIKIAQLMSDKVNRGQMEFMPDQDSWIVSIHHRYKEGETAVQIADSGGWNFFEIVRIIDMVEERKSKGELKNVPIIVKPKPPPKKPYRPRFNAKAWENSWEEEEE